MKRVLSIVLGDTHTRTFRTACPALEALVHTESALVGCAPSSTASDPSRPQSSHVRNGYSKMSLVGVQGCVRDVA